MRKTIALLVYVSTLIAVGPFAFVVWAGLAQRAFDRALPAPAVAEVAALVLVFVVSPLLLVVFAARAFMKQRGSARVVGGAAWCALFGAAFVVNSWGMHSLPCISVSLGCAALLNSAFGLRLLARRLSD